MHEPNRCLDHFRVRDKFFWMFRTHQQIIIAHHLVWMEYGHWLSKHWWTRLEEWYEISVTPFMRVRICAIIRMRW